MHYLAGFLLCSLTALSSSFAEDAQLRARAFELVEHSREVSTTKQSVANETLLTFHAVGADGITREGTYTRVFVFHTGVREEITSGNFHLVRIDLADRIAFIGPSRVLPPEVRAVLELFPIQTWHLDHEDVVRAIRQTNRKGQPAQCIEFDTIAGAQTNNNELCFDAQTGVQIYDRSGNTELENSAFFDFAGAKFPAHIRQYQNGVLKVDVQLTRRVIEDQVNADIFTPPTGADVGLRCQTFRRAFVQSMPQPAGNGGAVTNIVIHAVIGFDGKPHDAVIENSDRPDLNDEALRVVQGWTFTPAMCNGQPNTQEANLIVRFQGR
jgi:hypothetical protein